MFNRVRLWIRSIVLRHRLEREMQDEMSEHLEQSTRRLMARGVSAGEARRLALREFGNVPWLQEEARDARGTRWLDDLAADCRFAAGHFARKPGVTITMLVVLAFGMSISTLLFSYIHSYAVQPPAGIERSDELVRIRGSHAARANERSSRTFSEDEFLEYRNLTGQFAAVAGWMNAPVALQVGADDQRGLAGNANFVTENYFSVLGVQPLLGGLPSYEDPSVSAVAVIGHAVWDQLFARRPDVLGSTITVNGVPLTVVGVTAPRFTGVRMGSDGFHLWLPLATRRLWQLQSGEYRAAARLQAGVSADEATAAVQVVATRMATSDDARARDPSTDVVPLLAGNADPMYERAVWLASFSVGLLGLLVLLVTCTNVSALLTGLAVARRQEIAIRLSLGAGRTRIIRQLLTESVWLAGIAAAAALGVVAFVLRAATRFPELPFATGITWPSTLFTFGVALAVGVLFGLSPALHATRLGLASVLRDSTVMIAAAGSRLQRGLVIAQIACTQPLIVLLTAVLILVLRDLRPGLHTEFDDRVVTSFFRFGGPGMPRSDSARAEWLQQLRTAMRRVQQRVEATSGVEAAVLDWSSRSALGRYVVHPDDQAGGSAGRALELTGAGAAYGYFQVMGIPIVRGREFRAGDMSRADGALEVAAMVSADLARRLWRGADPLGRRLQAVSDSVTRGRTLVVVGVFDDRATAGAKDGERDLIYLPPDTVAFPGLLVRTAVAGEVLIPTLREVIKQELPGAVAGLRTLADLENERRQSLRTATSALSAGGLLALLLSAIGLYAVVAFSVSQRTTEIAVRVAVGARGRQIVQKFVGDGLRLSVFGLGIGLPVSLIALRLVTTIPGLPSVPLPPVTAIAALGVLVVAITAVWIPARRAASVDPAITLRRD
jgi:predicted permease